MIKYIIKHAHSAIAVHDRNLRYIFVSEKYLKDYKVEETNIIGKHHYEVFPDLPQKWRQVHQRVLKGEVLRMEWDSYPAPDGKTEWTRWECRPWYEPDGSIGGIIVYTEITTEKKLDEEKLRASEEKYRSLVEQSSEIHYLHDMAGNILEVNNETCIRSGYSKAELENMSVFDLLYCKNERNAIIKQWGEWSAGGYVIKTEANHGRKDGSTFPVELSVRKVAFGGRHYILALARDITGRKLSEKLTSARLRLVEYSRDHNVKEFLKKTLDEAEELTSSKVAFYHFIDQDTGTISLQEWSDNTTGKFCNIAENYKMHYPLSKAGIWTDCVKERRPIIHNDYEALPGRKGMPEGHAEIRRQLTVPVIRGNKIIAVLGVGNKEQDYSMKDVEIITQLAEQAWDIAEKKIAEDALKENELRLKEQNERYLALNIELSKARKKAEESDRLKTSFLANMSHEIRTPMNAIIGFSEMLLRPGIENDKHKAFTKIINSSCHQLLSLLDDIIDIAKIETGQMDIHKGKVNINHTISRIKNVFEPQAARKGVRIETYFDLPDQNAEIITDSSKLNQIMSNLAGNAVKFTEEGTIEIGYSSAEECMEFYVKDTGPGISKEYHEVIFDRFRQVDCETTRKHGGTGLGLHICKVLAEMLGGQIRLDSEPGKGSVFRFTIPCKQGNKTPDNLKEHKKTSYSFDGKVILVAEDEETNFLYLNELIEDKCARILRAHNGHEAVEVFNQNPDIDIILMDIKMPVMDGISATKKIKSQNKRHVPIIALTAYAMSGDREMCLNAGCDAYLSKPIMQDELYDQIARLLV